MRNKYSPSLNTFFLADFMARYEDAGTLPDDAVEVTEDVFNQYFGEPPEGKMLAPDSNGLPSWVDIEGVPETK